VFARCITTRQQPSRQAVKKRPRSLSPVKTSSKKAKTKAITTPTKHPMAACKQPKSLSALNRELAVSKKRESGSEDEDDEETSCDTTPEKIQDDD